MLFARFSSMSGIPLPCYLRGFQACPEFRFHAISEVLKHVRNSASMLFARFSHVRNSASMLLARFSSMSGIPLPCYLRGFQACPEFRFHAISEVLKHVRNSASMLLARFSHVRNSASMLFARFSSMSGIPLPCYLRGFRMSGIPLPCYLRGFQACPSRHGSSGRPRRTTFVLQKSTFQPRKLRVSAAYKVDFPATEAPGASVLQKVDFPATEAPKASVAYYICTTKVDFPATEAPGVPDVLRLCYKSRLSSQVSAAYYVCTTKSRLCSHGSSGCPRRTTSVYYKKSTFQPVVYYICTTKVDFPATEAPGVPDVLHLCYKSQLSSHGSSRVSVACYVCTTKVDFPATEAPRVRGVLRLYCKKSTLQPRKLRVSPAYYVCILQKVDFPARGVYYICTTKVDFPATEAPGVPDVLHLYYKSRFPATEAPGVRGVLRLYYKSRLSSHGGSACPWRTTFVLQNSIVQPRKSSAYYVCTTQVEKKTHKTQNHYGFSTTTMRKPAEGLRLYVRKCKNTRVLAPRQRRNPQRGYVCMSKNAKTRRFWHRANAQTRRGLSAATKKSTKNDGFSTATRRSPAEGCPRMPRNVKKRRF